MAQLRPAGYAWCGLTLYVIILDSILIIQERRGKPTYYTMSTGFRYALKHPVKRWPVILMWLFLTFHLFDFFFPPTVRRFEPVGAVGRFLGQHLSCLTPVTRSDVVEYLSA